MPNDTRLSEAKRKLLELQRRGNLAPPTNPPARAKSGPIPLSLSQEQVWQLQRTVGAQSPLYNESITLHRHGPCDAAAMEKAFAEIIRRHEIWRTTFAVQDGQPIQVIHPPPANFKLQISDLRSALEIGEGRGTGLSSAPSAEGKALKLATEDAQQPFDLARGPLLRARLVNLSDKEHQLFLTAHQSIVDGTTVYDVFPTELTTLYESFAAGKPSPLPELEIQFAEYACEQRQRLTGAERQRQLDYWKKQLAGDLIPLRWPNAHASAASPTYHGAIHPFSMGKDLTESLLELARREGVTLFMILLAGLATLLHRYAQQDDVTVVTLAPSGRKFPEFQRLTGYFLNPVPLRTDMSGNPTFRELLRQAREITLGAISNDDLPLETIAEHLQVRPGFSRHLLFNIALSVAPDVAILPPGWSMTFMDVESGGSRWDLYFELSQRPGGLLGRAQYNPDVFTLTMVKQAVDDLQSLLKSLLGDPAQGIDSPVLSGGVVPP